MILKNCIIFKMIQHNYAVLTGWQMNVAEIFDNFLTLGPFSGARGPQDKNDVRFCHFEGKKGELFRKKRFSLDDGWPNCEETFCQHQIKNVFESCAGERGLNFERKHLRLADSSLDRIRFLFLIFDVSQQLATTLVT